MKQGFTSNHWLDSAGNPAGGRTSGVGFTVSWQNGPLGREPNGAFVEDVLDAARDRLLFYQNTKGNSAENAEALIHIERAMRALGAAISHAEGE